MVFLCTGYFGPRKTHTYLPLGEFDIVACTVIMTTVSMCQEGSDLLFNHEFCKSDRAKGQFFVLTRFDLNMRKKGLRSDRLFYAYLVSGHCIIDLNFYSDVVLCSSTMAVLFVGVGMRCVQRVDNS